MRLRIALLGLVIGLAAPAWGGALERTFRVGPGGRLVIALDFGRVALHAQEGDTLRIEARSRGVGASSVHFAARSEGADVYLQGEAEPWVTWLRSAPGVRVDAWVPPGTRVTVEGRGEVEVVREVGGVLVMAP